MNTIDVLVLVVLFANGLIGAFRGFVWQAFRIGSLVLGLFLGWRYAGDVAELIEPVMGREPSEREVVAYVAILLTSYVVLRGLGYLLRGLLNRSRLSSTDRALGFLLGGLKGAIFVAIAFQIILFFHPLLPGEVQVQLRGGPSGKPPPSQAFELHRSWLSHRLNGMIPDSMKEDVLRGIEDARKR